MMTMSRGTKAGAGRIAVLCGLLLAAGPASIAGAQGDDSTPTIFSPPRSSA